MSKKILFVGESWVSYTTHLKGFDPFYTTEFDTGHTYLQDALINSGYEVTYMPNHAACTQFPYSMDEIKKYDCIILSDIGSNTLLLPPETFKHGKRTPNRCQLIKDYVLQGGSLLMVGGYMTFTGIDGKGRWGMTAVQDILPVKLLPYDDRMEHPEGIHPNVVDSSHEILTSIASEWPFFLGYNKSIAMEDAEVPVTIDGDPFIALAERGEGRSAIFASDCAPHWGPQEFLNWESFDSMWKNIIDWLTK